MQTEAAAAKALVSMESPAVCVPPLSTGAVPRVACPRCQSMDTKFCYLNNYNPNQPRWLCKVRAARRDVAWGFWAFPPALAATARPGHRPLRRSAGHWMWPVPGPQRRARLLRRVLCRRYGCLRACSRPWLTLFRAPHAPASPLPHTQSCQRYWTAGGTLRNVQPGAGRRKNKQSGSAEVPPVATSLAPSPSARPLPPPKEGSADGSGTEPVRALSPPVVDTVVACCADWVGTSRTQEDAVLRPRSTRRRTQRARRGDSTSAAAPDGATPTPSPPQSSAPPLPLPWFAWSPAAALAAAHAPAGFPMCWAFDPSAAMWPYAMAAQQQAAAAQASLAAAQHVRLGSCDAPQLSRPKALYASGFHAPSGEAAGSLYGGLSHPALVPTPGPGAASLWANPSAFARSLALQQQACEQASAGAAKRQREGGDATQG